jgi:hypothetical protein
VSTLICTVEMSKSAGVTIKVTDSDGKVTQTVTMDGTTMTLKVADSSNTSTITQKADSVVIKCKDFQVDAETITCASTGATKHSSGDTLAVESTGDMSLSSKAKLTGSATSDVEISGMNIKASATTEASLAGMTVKAEATQALTLKSNLTTDLGGTMVTINADGMLEAKSSGISTFKGSVSNIQGSLINAG